MNASKYGIAGFSLVFSAEIGVSANIENYTHVVLYSKNKTDNWLYILQAYKTANGLISLRNFITVNYQI